MDLVKMIIKEVQNLETSGRLNEIVKTHVEKCVEGIVADSYKWDGEAKKAIKEGLAGKLGVPLGKIKLDQYGKIVTDIVNTQLENTVFKDLKHDIGETITDITGHLEKKEWKLSDIIDAFIEQIDKSYDSIGDEYGEISLHVDDERKDSVFVRFDDEADKSEYECKNRLYIYKGKLSSVTLDNVAFTPSSTNSMCQFERFMFRLYANGATIEIDNCETEYAAEYER